MKIAITVAITAAVAALCVPAATATPTHRTSTQARSFCSTAKAISKYLASTLTLTNGVAKATPANLKLAYTTVTKSEPALKASAPKSLRPSLTKAFSFINLAKKDLAKANWHTANLTPYLPALVAKYKATAKSIKVVRAYLHGTCHLAV
jgi:hypothetical protein